MKKSTLYIIQGFIGAGKSTFSRKLAFEKGAVHLNPDEWVTKLYDKSVYTENWNDCFEKTVCQLWDKTKQYLKNGKDVIFDMGFWFKKDRNYAREVATECKANLTHYYLNIPDEILKERIKASRPPEWANMHLKNFDNNKKLFQPPEPDEKVIVITNF